MRHYDVEEIAIGHFIVRDARASQVLRGEGELAGQRFTLTSHRRAGLLARLRERGFRVRAFEDRIAALPRPRGAPPPGPPAFRPLDSPADRLSYFEPALLRWEPLEPQTRDGVTGVVLRPGWALRRRKGRGAADYYLVQQERAGLGLRSVSEDQALLAGYAQAAAMREIVLYARVRGDAAELPDVALPPGYRDELRRIGRAEGGALLVDERAWPFAQDIFARLGADLRADSRG